MILAAITYPISGPLGELLFVVEMIIMFFSAELALLFLYRFWKARKNPEEKESEILWSILLMGWSAMWGFIVTADFQAQTSELKQLYLGLAFIASGAGMFIFVIYGEIRLRRGFVFTILFGSFSILFMVFFLAIPSIMEPFAAGEGAAFIIVVSVSLARMNRFARLGYKYYLTLFVGISCLYLGFLGTLDFIIQPLGTLLVRAFTDCIELTGVCLLALFFSYVPNFAEFNWRNQVKFIILFEKESGTVLFSQKMTLEFYNIGAKQAQLDEYLIASALTGVKLLLDQVNKDKGDTPPVKSFKQETGYVCLEYGIKFAVAAICEHPSSTLERLLKVFVRKVDIVYQNALQTWKGDSRVFDSIKYLFRSIFMPPKTQNSNIPVLS